MTLSRGGGGTWRSDSWPLRVAVARVGGLGHDARMPIFLDDQVGRSRRDDQLDRRVLMPRHDEEPSAFCADSLVVEAGQLDEVGARDPRTFADELVVVSTEPPARLWIDSFTSRKRISVFARPSSRLSAGVRSAADMGKPQ